MRTKNTIITINPVRALVSNIKYIMLQAIVKESIRHTLFLKYI